MQRGRIPNRASAHSFRHSLADLETVVTRILSFRFWPIPVCRWTRVEPAFHRKPRVCDTSRYRRVPLPISLPIPSRFGAASPSRAKCDTLPFSNASNALRSSPIR